jgi:hypothetical protein
MAGSKHRRTTSLTFVSDLFDGYLLFITRQAWDRHLRVVLTGMAQGQRAGLITLRTLDRNELPVFSNLAVLQKLQGASSAHYAVLKPLSAMGFQRVLVAPVDMRPRRAQ